MITESPVSAIDHRIVPEATATDPTLVIQRLWPLILLLPPQIKGKTCSHVFRTPLKATAGGASGEMRIRSTLVSTWIRLPCPRYSSPFSENAEVVLRTGPSIHADL